MHPKSCITLIMLIAIVGCSSSKSVPASFYYILDTMSQEQPIVTRSQDNSQQIKVSPVVLPDYLNQPNLVLKLSDHQIKIANYHFWAEDLRQSIQQVLINELNMHNPDTSYTQACVECDELIITIDHFYPTESGEVVLMGSYFLTSNYTQNRFMFRRELNQGGYDEAVSAMRALLSELADQI